MVFMERKEEIYNPHHINYALVEGVRPPMYSAMKYWGRKPHNIWSDYISHYCPEGGTVLDPFVGSGITAFEALKSGRKVVATDLNPLSSFVIETTLSKFDSELFRKTVERLLNEIKGDAIYKEHFVKNIDDVECTVYNYIWENGCLKSVRAKSPSFKEYDLTPSAEDIEKSYQMNDINIPYWYPTDKFPINPSITQNFIHKAGGDSFDYLWTRRNLYVLSKLFDMICAESKDVSLHLMFAFIHTLHLVSKMVVPRGEKGDRKFSGSWGRADYMIRNRVMEQNPLVVFERSCFDRQGVEKAMTDAMKQMPAKYKANCLGKTNGRYHSKSDVTYGVCDVADLLDVVPEATIDFIITDPPYGGLVQYMDLSMVWLVWLKKYDVRYTPDASGEITYKKNISVRENYRRKLVKAFRNMFRVLKPDHYMVVTFHSQDIREWNDFICAIRESGFKFEKVTHQYNKRSGESNVSNPYGTTGSDFYIRCKKVLNLEVDSDPDKQELSSFVINKTREILIERSEPTAFTFILNGLLPDMLQAGYLEPDEPAEEIMKILSAEIGEEKMFSIEKNVRNQSGDIFWFNKPSEHINQRNIPLKDRLDLTIKSLLRRKVSVKYDDVVAEVFKKYPNGLTPDPKSIHDVVAAYAQESNGKWKLKDVVERDCSEHTLIISLLCKLATKIGLFSFVGKREQYESLDSGKRLSDISDYVELGCLAEYDVEQRERIEMMDVVWIKDNKISAVFEVENSTNFIAALSRSSNILHEIPKYMIIPPRRVNELIGYKDPLFTDAFSSYNWKYLDYDDVNRLCGYKKVTIESLDKIAKTI